jgi:hypothetical protein
VLGHCRASARAGHAAPPSLAAVEMERWRLRVLSVLLPQLAAHVPHVCHALTVQSTGHAPVLHGVVVSVSGHAAPAPRVGLSTPRVRCAVPPSQVSEHAAQLDHASTMQLAGGTASEDVGAVAGDDGGESVGVGAAEEGIAVDGVAVDGVAVDGAAVDGVAVVGGAVVGVDDGAGLPLGEVGTGVVGLGVGVCVGAELGAGVGVDVGAGVGAEVGAGVGVDVGAGVGTDVITDSPTKTSTAKRFVLPLVYGTELAVGESGP